VRERNIRLDIDEFSLGFLMADNGLKYGKNVKKRFLHFLILGRFINSKV
jgi:hypothetical protein